MKRNDTHLKNSQLFYIPEKIYSEMSEKVTQYMLANGIKNTESKTTLYLSKIQYIISKIVEQRIYRPDSNNGYSLLNYDKLGETVGQRYVGGLLAALQRWGWVESDNYFISPITVKEGLKRGVNLKPKSKGYKIAQHYQSPIVSTFILNETLEAKLERKKAEYTGKSKPTKYLHQQLQKFGIYGDEAKAYAKAKYVRSIDLLNSFDVNHYDSYLNAVQDRTEPFYTVDEEWKIKVSDTFWRKPEYEDVYESIDAAYSSDLVLINKIETGDYYLKEDDTSNRCHTPISGLSNGVTKFLYYKNTPSKKLYNIDLKNSQLFFLALYLRDDYYKGLSLPQDVQEFSDCTSQGQFYELMLDLLGVDHSKRSKFKKKIFGKVVYCKTKTTEGSKEGRAFIQRFPNVAQAIKEAKDPDYKNLPILMQKKEVEAIIHRVIPRLQKFKIVVTTKHDSCIVVEDDIQIVKDIIEDEFNKEYRFVPKVSVEPLEKNHETDIQQLHTVTTPNWSELTEEEQYAYGRFIKMLLKNFTTRHVEEFRVMEIGKMKKMLQDALPKIREADRIKAENDSLRLKQAS